MTDDISPAKMAHLIRASTYNLYLATLAGPTAKRFQHLREDLINPQVGNMVCEISTAYHRNELTAVGRLEEIAEEPVDFGPGAEPWDEAEEGRPHPTERVWYLRTLDGGSHRWTNARFIKVPDRIFDPAP